MHFFVLVFVFNFRRIYSKQTSNSLILVSHFNIISVSWKVLSYSWNAYSFLRARIWLFICFNIQDVVTCVVCDFVQSYALNKDYISQKMLRQDLRKVLNLVRNSSKGTQNVFEVVMLYGPDNCFSSSRAFKSVNRHLTSS